MAKETLILDRYKPLGMAGSGGFGTVRIAWDQRIQRKVAIKTIELSETDALRAALPGADAVQRPSEPRFERIEWNAGSPTADRWHGVQPWNEFLEEGGDSADAESDEADAAADPVTALAHVPGLDEARTAAMLSDTRIVTVYDFEVRGQTAYLIMEYVEGLTLTRILADYGDMLTLDMVAAVLDAVAGALAVAHKAGVLHLDIKPDNIIVNEEGQAKVTDFGLATLADASGAGTTGGGTIGYMPLEQMRREPLDARTDEWSLASMLYEMLTGENPFRARDLAAAERAIEEAELVVPSLCWDDIDEQIDDVVFFGLDPDPDRRYESVADFSEEAAKFLGDPIEGKAELAGLVKAALRPRPDEETGVEADDEPVEAVAVRSRKGLFSRMRDGFGALAQKREPASEGDGEQFTTPGARESAPRTSDAAFRRPLAERVPDAAKVLAARAYAAFASGFLTCFALLNVPALGAAFGTGAAYVVGAAVVIVALAGAAAPSVGALASTLLLAVALLSCGHPVVALAVAAASVAWWYFVARGGLAAANTALLLPPVFGLGAEAALPFAAGSTLRVVDAIATTAFSLVLAFVLEAVGFDLLGSWDFTQADVTANLVHYLTRPVAWATAAGWIAAAAVLSAATRFEARWLHVAGLAVATACALAGSLAFAPPTPALFIAVILADVVLLAL